MIPHFFTSVLQLGQKTVKAKMCGTLEFMSPEVMNCTEATFASGIYSLEDKQFIIILLNYRHVGHRSDNLLASVRRSFTLLGWK